MPKGIELEAERLERTDQPQARNAGAFAEGGIDHHRRVDERLASDNVRRDALVGR